MSQAVDVKPCLPAFATDALFPIALTLLVLGLIATGALIWAALRWDLHTKWALAAGLITAGFLVLTFMSRMTC